MAEYQRHPLSRPHDVGQDFWAVNYAGPSLMDRQKYIDPRTGQVWESLEEALKYANIEASIPDIRSSDIWRGPPVEGSVRTPTERIESVIPVDYPPSEVTVSGIPEVSSGVPVQRDDLSNWRVNQEHELRKALEREETEPQLQNIKTSMLSRLIPSAQASDLAPLPPPQISPTQIEPPEVGPSLLEPPPIPIKAKTIDLPGGKIENGELVLDESPEAWAEFINRRVEVPRVGRTEEAAPEEKGGLLDDLESLNREDMLQNILDLLVSKAGASKLLDSSDPIDTLYAALSDAEHRSDEHRKNRWIYADVPGADEKKAWGPVQMKPIAMKEARRVGDLTPEEEEYVNRFVKGERLVDEDSKVLYISIAKKLLRYYLDEYNDPVKVADAWRYGPTGAKTQSIKVDDTDYWKAFKKTMGL